jgi:response regulator RpfG family c-di-GMP phosphodiesterase
MSAKPILLVDDEVNVLSSLSRSLVEEGFETIQTARNGQEAIEIIKNTPDLAIIVTDYRMPGMNGIELLAHARENFPDITRILLTGAADLEMALNAVNQGHLFRFLLKPCSPDSFLTAIRDGLRQNELINAERELLSKTLSGSVKVMIDILALLSPGIFAQAGRLRNLARDLASALHYEDQTWEIELAALLSQIGAVTIPPKILERWQRGEVLDEAEAKMVRSIPRIGKLLISNIPRLENIAEAVAAQNIPYSSQAGGEAPGAEKIPLMGRILKIIITYDRLMEKSHSPTFAIETMLVHEAEYDPSILNTFRLNLRNNDYQSSYKLSGLGSSPWSPRTKGAQRRSPLESEGRHNNTRKTIVHRALRGEKEITIEGIKLGMSLSRDVSDQNGVLIVPKGTVITDVLIYKLINYFHSHAISEFVYIESDY